MNTFFLAEKISLLYCVGLGLLTLEMAALSFFGIKFSVFSLAACIALLVAVALLTMPRQVKSGHRGKALQPLGGLEKFFVFGISFEILYAFFRTLISFG